MNFRRMCFAFGLAAGLSVGMVRGSALAEQVKITAKTDVSPAGIAKIISQEMTSTLPPRLLEIAVNYISAQVMIDECRGLRKNDAKFYAALDTALERENRYDRQDFDRHIRNLPEERLYELISYFLYSIGARDNDKASFCAAGRGQMKAGTQLGTFLLE